MVAAEQRHRAYGEAIGLATEALRPSLEVVVASTREMEEMLALLQPEVVFCVRAEPACPAADTLAWVEVSVEPGQSSETRVGERRSQLYNPSLEQLVAVIDEAERLLRAKAASEPKG